MVCKKSMFLHLLQIGLIFGQPFSGDHHHHSLLSDKDALLEFKRTIKSDPRSALSNWDQAFDVCNFTGVRCGRLRHRVVQLELKRTEIGGLLSPFIANLTGLRFLDLSDNQLYGYIPPEFASLRYLHGLRLSRNILQGPIPDSLSHISKLNDLRLEGNNLTATIPGSIFSNCTSLNYVDLSSNFFIGEIPSEVGYRSKLWVFHLYSNFLRGKLPVSLSNCSLLLSLDVENNYLSGELPSEVVVKLQDIEFLQLSDNSMVSHDGNTNLEPFFTSLTNCTKLVELELAALGLGGRLPKAIGDLGIRLSTIHLEDNQIFGEIPQNIANLSSLTWLNMSTNLLNGTIPEELSKLKNVERLILSTNSLTSTIPASLGNITWMGLLDLSKNRLWGKIPETLGNLSLLNYLFLNENNLSGSIPPSLGHCNLHKLDLSYNRLTGSIPQEISGLNEMRIFLNLSHNLLQGPLPVELSKMESIQEIDLSSNNLTGKIFPQLSNCISVRLINFSNNSLEGQLPDSLGNLQNLESFDLSSNSLSGKIPISLNKCTSLTFLNLSYNNFDGLIPTGGIFNSITYLSFLGNIHLCGSVSGKVICQKRRNWIHSQMFLIIVPTIISALAFLSTIYCVIRFQCIKGIISSRKDEILSRSAPELKQNFPRVAHSELSEATGGFDHLPDFKAFVLPYMANGSLEARLYPHSETGLGSGSSDLSLIQRNMGNSTANMLHGSIGYIAPEYGFGMSSSTKGDVYSFGILVLEMVTRKRPTNDMFVEGLSLHKWVKRHYHGRVENIVDTSLMRAAKDQPVEVKKMWEVAIGELIELGILCTQESPSTRPTMLDAADDLDRLKRYLDGDTSATFSSSLGILSSTLDEED
ncbi:hypothetical protein HHK36_025942 [Tetracentron sinense]|uniref:Protein kinase domain-containing protein n=1 Tax=Tetracentron sinense TaxID=13715 RepID=A0A834YHU4_TETSI|nr:hypothetical protein HHK36_025942 [Tetracentron sinense]